MEEFFSRIVADHAKAVLAGGVHDDECEWRPTGHFVCNCLARKRIAAGFTTLPGALHYSYPTCPRCHDEVDHDGDSFVCYECRVSWDTDRQDDEGTFLDANEPLDVAAWDVRDAERAAAAAVQQLNTTEES